MRLVGTRYIVSVAERQIHRHFQYGGVYLIGVDTLGSDTLGSDTLGSDTLGSDRLDSDRLGSDRLGSDTLGSDTLGSDTLGSDTLGSDTIYRVPTRGNRHSVFLWLESIYIYPFAGNGAFTATSIS